MGMIRNIFIASLLLITTLSFADTNSSTNGLAPMPKGLKKIGAGRGNDTTTSPQINIPTPTNPQPTAMPKFNQAPQQQMQTAAPSQTNTSTQQQSSTPQTTLTQQQPITQTTSQTGGQFTQTDQQAWMVSCIKVFGSADPSKANQICTCAWDKISGGALTPVMLHNGSAQSTQILQNIGAECAKEVNGQ